MKRIIDKYINDKYYYDGIQLVQDRYNGAISGFKWYCSPYSSLPEFDEYINADDGTAHEFWLSRKVKYFLYDVGTGDTIEEAIEDLLMKLEKIDKEKASNK